MALNLSVARHCLPLQSAKTSGEVPALLLSAVLLPLLEHRTDVLKTWMASAPDGTSVMGHPEGDSLLQRVSWCHHQVRFHLHNPLALTSV